LEAESLVFTVNTLGDSGWATRHLHLGLLPGDRMRPLFRMVVRKESVAENYSLDLSPWVEKLEGFPRVVGRLIPHTTQNSELGDAFPLQTTLGDVEAVQRGPYLLARAGDGAWETGSPLHYACDTVLPKGREPDGRPTVFVVLQFLAVGGAEQLALHLLNHLHAEIRFVVISADPLDPGLGTLTDAFRAITPWVYNLPDFLDPPLRTSFLWHLVDRFNPSALYIANGATWIYDLLPGFKARYPHIRTSGQVYDAQFGWINHYNLGLVLSLDAHIGANQRICQAYLDRGAEPERVHLIEHGIDPDGLDPQEYPPEKIAEVRQKLGLRDGQRVVTFASRLHPQKRPLDFVELARRMSADSSVAFLMMGDGALAGVVDEQAARLGLQNFQRRAFYRPIADVLAVSDVVVLPSEYEGMPLIVAEAQIMGKPVVVTDVGNNREMLEISGGGVVVPQIGDVNGLMRGVQEMLARPPDPARVREAILERVGIEVIARKYRSVILGDGDA
jgi:glycosyltransferase involved in cell wall biosynthesis